MANNEKIEGHGRIETNNFLMIVLITLVVAVGGLVEIVPLFFQKSTTTPIEGLKPYSALQLAGRDVYVSEGCYNCHSQMIRPFQAETLRYGPYSVAGEFVYDRPFQWGSKRTGPDLHRVGGRYSDEWHRVHLNNPRDVVPESNMPAYAFLGEKSVDADSMPKRMEVLRTLGAPYSDEEIAQSVDAVKGKTQMEAVIAYLQVLGTARSANRIRQGVGGRLVLRHTFGHGFSRCMRDGRLAQHRAHAILPYPVAHRIMDQTLFLGQWCAQHQRQEHRRHRIDRAKLLLFANHCPHCRGFGTHAKL